jgi:hypothetical protein
MRTGVAFGGGLAAGLALLLTPLFVVHSQEATPSPHGALVAECSTCHTADGWRPLKSPVGFDHEGTGFALVAAHSQATCRDCHESLVFSHVGTACADCHRDAHRGELGSGCDTCHVPESWSARHRLFDVHSRTRFPLLAAHTRLDCESCHRGQQPREYVNTPTECVSCHLADYAATRDPDHQRLRFPRECETCHSPASAAWQGGTFGGAFAHPATFPLRGAHASLSCSTCHASGFTGTPRDCVACHRDDYDGAQDPNHRAGNFSTSCQGCHTDSAWRPATFDHALSRFPLTGAHTRLDCAQCHVGGRFQGTPSDCVSCHQDDYDRTSNPNHRASSFPTGCPACHSTNAWRPATFDHNRFFPIASGDHSGIACASCHPNAGSFAAFSCVTCHEHERSEMDDEHRRVSGYRYESRACLSCHPRGQE